jgi:hypothetical protein
MDALFTPHLLAEFPMLIAKAGSFLLLLCLSASLTGCGIEVKDDDLEDGEGGAEVNEVSALLDGENGMELESRAVTCREVSGDAFVVDFDGDASGSPDAQGIKLRLEVVGDLDEGDALTPDNSSLDRFFDLRLATPDGAYRYDSLDTGGAAAPGYAALTVLEAGDITTRLRLWIEGLAGGGQDGSGFRATFTCNRWDD